MELDLSPRLGGGSASSSYGSLEGKAPWLGASASSSFDWRGLARFDAQAMRGGAALLDEGATAALRRSLSGMITAEQVRRGMSAVFRF
jgi:hypothetical protein